MLLSVFIFILAGGAWPQSQGSERQTPARPAGAESHPASAPALEPATSQQRSPSKTESKRSLMDAMRVSTENATRSAAADLASKGKSRAAGAKATNPVAHGSPVEEFHSAGTAPDAIVAASKSSKDSALKNLHGTAYGALGSANSDHRAGGSAGATSKKGKASIYLETNQSRATSPR